MFSCLLKDRTLHYSPSKASKIIISCIVLHNLCIEANVPLLNDEADGNLEFDLGVYDLPPANENNVRNRQNPELVAGLRIRQNIVNRLFTE